MGKSAGTKATTKAGSKSQLVRTCWRKKLGKQSASVCVCVQFFQTWGAREQPSVVQVSVVQMSVVFGRGSQQFAPDLGNEKHEVSE